MIKSILIAGSALCLSVVSSAVSATPIFSDTLGSGAASVNPTDFPGGPVISTSGLTISGGENYSYIIYSPDMIYLNDPGPITLTFTHPTTAFGFDFITDFTNLDVTAYNASDQVLEQYTFPVGSLPTPQYFPQGYAGFSGLNGVTSVSITTDAGINTVFIGTVSYLSVPELSTWALLMAGIGGVGLALRRVRGKGGLMHARALAG